MKALFLIYHGFEEHNGISKKIHYQIQAFKECGVEMHLCYFTDTEGHKVRWIDKEPISDYGVGFKSKILKRTDFASIVSYIVKNNISLVYARHDHNANPFTIALYKDIQETGCKLVLEIPTYPYDQEYNGFPFSERANLFIDKTFRKQLVSHTDYIITFSSNTHIWGKETIRISNGIDFSQIPIKRQINDTTSVLNLIGVAEIHYWHGFDRVLKGLGEYYKTERPYKVYFHLIGNTGEKHGMEFREIIQAYSIEEYIIFHGALHGEALNEQFEKADLGIGSLGRHRSGITDIKTLKNREYAARGIPFIYSEMDSDFDNRSYVLKEPANEEAINIEELITFYESSNWNPAEIRDSIIDLSWKNQMQKVLDKLFKHEKEN
ncbi:glycosyltransferase family 1 protein [Bacteroides sp. 214]|uniref:glycosyltransferase family 4 protein n=1 Tax=Bacteroides sp. 214 TaxID=2302935 RepID=UPI0013D677FE|nr:glycosyltransferase family 4 protein [Bacteroides sp. 214]NDW12746.1 glycosyltransferase family 1 protein [Bacteroides sp. 214]